MRLTVLALLTTLAAVPALAADEDARFSFGGDTYEAGRTVDIDDADRSVFAAGETVTLNADISGSAHIAGRSVSIDGALARMSTVSGWTLICTRQWRAMCRFRATK